MNQDLKAHLNSSISGQLLISQATDRGFNLHKTHRNDIITSFVNFWIKNEKKVVPADYESAFSEIKAIFPKKKR